MLFLMPNQQYQSTEGNSGTLMLPFYGHHAKHPQLRNRNILFELSFTSHIPLLKATSTFDLGGKKLESNPNMPALQKISFKIERSFQIKSTEEKDA